MSKFPHPDDIKNWVKAHKAIAWIVFVGIVCGGVFAIITFITGKNLPDFFAVDNSAKGTTAADTSKFGDELYRDKYYVYGTRYLTRPEWFRFERIGQEWEDMGYNDQWVEPTETYTVTIEFPDANGQFGLTTVNIPGYSDELWIGSGTDPATIKATEGVYTFTYKLFRHRSDYVPLFRGTIHIDHDGIYRIYDPITE